MEDAPRHSTLLRLLVAPARIHFLCSVMEAYEGLAVVTTLEPRCGLVEIGIAPGCESMVRRILETERRELELREMAGA